MSIVPNLDEMTDEQKLAVLESVQKSIAESKEIQKRKIGENVELVVQALKKIESDIRDRFDGVGTAIEKRVASIKDGRDGANGKDGRDGKDGKSGRDGLKGDRGVDGQAGRDGVDGVDGVSVINANIDFDGSLIISLSDGREINVGEVVSADVAEKIKVISTMSTNAAIAVKEEGTTITNGVKSLNFVGTGITATTSGDDVTVTVAGGGGSGTVTSVAALTLGTSGTDLSSTVANSTTTPVITLNVPTASATNRGALSSADWTTFNNKGSGTVTSVTGTSPVVSSGGATPAISLASGYGDTLNPYASKTANFVLAAPNGSAGVPTFRAIVAADIPTLNQNTTGSAATLTTPRAIYGNNFDGSAALTQVIASTYGGTGNGFTKFTGATTAERTYTLPDASSTIVVQGGALGTPSSGTVTNLTGTASININGTVGATTKSTGAFTTISSTGTITAGSTNGTVTAGLGILTLESTDNNDVVINCGSTRQTIFKAGGTEKARLNSSAAFVLAGGNTASNGAGIAFPATQSASSDANTLDDYEEGNWTPTQGAGLTVVGAFSSSGRYTKIGRQVFIEGVVTGGTSVAIPSVNAITISSLPFSQGFSRIPGLAGNEAISASAAFQVIGTNLYFMETMAATTNIRFSATYSV